MIDRMIDKCKEDKIQNRIKHEVIDPILFYVFKQLFCFFIGLTIVMIFIHKLFNN